MAHMIEGRRMMYVGETPWHGIGTKLDSPPTVEDGIRAAGLDWTVRMERLQMADGRQVQAYATVRSEDGAVLGDHVGPKYHPLQNIDAFKFFQPFLDSGAATLHTAGCLDSGRRVWVLAKIGADPLSIAPNDTVESYILLSNSHDGSLAVRVGFTPIRVVCQNTLSMAHGDQSSKLLRVRHTRSVNDALALIRDVMDLANREFAATATQYRALAARHVSTADMRKYVRQVFNAGEDEKADSGRMRNMIDDVLYRAEYGAGNGFSTVRGTYWAAYNGVTEYLTHARGSDRSKRLDSLWFGNGAETSKRALELAVSLAV